MKKSMQRVTTRQMVLNLALPPGFEKDEAFIERETLFLDARKRSVDACLEIGDRAWATYTARTAKGESGGR